MRKTGEGFAVVEPDDEDYEVEQNFFYMSCEIGDDAIMLPTTVEIIDKNSFSMKMPPEFIPIGPKEGVINFAKEDDNYISCEIEGRPAAQDIEFESRLDSFKNLVAYEFVVSRLTEDSSLRQPKWRNGTINFYIQCMDGETEFNLILSKKHATALSDNLKNLVAAE